MTELSDESMNAVMNFTQSFLDDGSLIDVHISIKNKVLKVNAKDSSGWTYQFIRREK